MRIEAAGIRADHGDFLHIAGSDAAAAEDALVVVADHMRGGVVELVVRVRALVARFVIYAELFAELLQFAAAAAHAGEALAVVRGEDKLQGDFAGIAHLFCICKDLHAFIHRVNTGGNQASRTLDLHHADPARADFIDILEVTQRRDLDPGIARRFEDRNAVGHTQGHAVDFDIDHFH